MEEIELKEDLKNDLSNLLEKMEKGDFSEKVISYNELRTNVIGLRRSGYDMRKFEKKLDECWDNWTDIIKNLYPEKI